MVLQCCYQRQPHFTDNMFTDQINALDFKELGVEEK